MTSDTKIPETLVVPYTQGLAGFPSSAVSAELERMLGWLQKLEGARSGCASANAIATKPSARQGLGALLAGYVSYLFVLGSMVRNDYSYGCEYVRVLLS